MYVAALILLLASVSATAHAQPSPIPIGELTDSMRLRPKPALVLITTAWCTYCRMQQNQLKKSGELQHALSHVYFSELDAESREALVFNGQTYRFVPTGVATGRHELAFVLGEIDSRLAYPTWVMLNERFEIVFKFPGVIKASELFRLLEAMPWQSPSE